MAAIEVCPKCEGANVWIEERPRGLEFGCHHCNHQWNTNSEAAR